MIRIDGSGPAAAAAEFCLRQAGVEVWRSPAPPSNGPIVTLNRPTLELFADLFGQAAFRSLVAHGRQLKRRAVSWTDEDETTSVDDPALLIATSDIARAIDDAIPDGAQNCDVGGEVLTLAATGRRQNSGEPAGRRKAGVWPRVRLERMRPDTAHLQAVPGGWAFLAPVAPEHALIQIVVPVESNDCDPVDAMRDVAAHAVSAAGLAMTGDRLEQALAESPRMFDATPRLDLRRQDNGLAIGDRIMALDPLSGDGVGHALRSAVLLAAALAEERYMLDALSLYHARLRRAFADHLAICERYYTQIVDASRWERQIESMGVLRGTIIQTLQHEPAHGYVLRRLKLERTA